MSIDRTRHRSQLYTRHLSPEDYTKEETYKLTRAPVDLAVTMLPDAYTSDEFFDIERERVFAKSWIAVGCTSKVERPGQTLVAELGQLDLNAEFVGVNAAGLRSTRSCGGGKLAYRIELVSDAGTLKTRKKAPCAGGGRGR